MHFPSHSSLAARSLWAVALMLWAGCKSSTYLVQVDAISQTGQGTPPTAEPKSYRVRSHNPNVADDSLRYHEVSAYIKTALSGKGLYEAPSAETADLIIDIDYGMETPRMKYQTVTKPIIVITAGQPKPQPDRSPGGSRAFLPINGSTGMPMGKIAGWQEEAEPVVVYEKYLKVSARENREAVEGRAAPEVWSVNVSAEDPSNELRKYLPILASATADYIGTNTRQEKAVSISENGDSVKFIKKGM
jgi:hypothetical protein